MDPFHLFAGVFAVAALFSYLNHRFLGLPTTIGVMAMGLVASIALLVLDALGLDIAGSAELVVEQLEFRESLLGSMLAFLLFAGALHVDGAALSKQWRVVSLLATVGIVVTTFLVATCLFAFLWFLGIQASYLECLLFGALISPTDPIAVLGVLTKVGAPKSLETKIAGESLFNDGVGVVFFAVILGLVTGSGAGPSGAVVLFAQEVVGGLVLGLAGGAACFYLLRSIEDYSVEVLLTLALAAGLYSLAMALHTSGPLAVVVAGLFIGNTGRRFGMDEATREHLDTFWKLVDEVLNVFLFALIGLELLVIDFSPQSVLLGVLAVPVVLFGRWVSITGVVRALGRVRVFTPGAITILTWGGLRGGISVALALSIPPSVAGRSWILAVTYVVVVFSILVQGLTIGRLVRSKTV
ncbi:MAG: sodium:proton antiporter [Planctomycetota bacterium]